MSQLCCDEQELKGINCQDQLPASLAIFRDQQLPSTFQKKLKCMNSLS